MALLFLSLFFLPHGQPFNIFHIWYFEIILMLGLPVFFVVFLFKNDVNLYWAISVIFATIPYGLLSHPPKAMILYPTSVAVTMAMLHYTMGGLPNFSLGVQIQIPAYFLVFLLGVIQTIIKKTYAIAQREYQRSEELLQNILPIPIIKRLKINPTIIAEHIAHSTILFADIVEFTTLSETMPPKNLVMLLNDIFSLFDQLTDKYKLEKIKTIGDAYMVVSGIPEPRHDHAEAIADMALEMLHELKMFNMKNTHKFNLRIGIHSGPVVAGVIGHLVIHNSLLADKLAPF
jgi:hypothetical protein